MALIIGGTAAHEIAKSLLGQVHIQQKTGLDRKKKRKEKKKEKKKKDCNKKYFKTSAKMINVHYYGLESQTERPLLEYKLLPLH